MHFSSLSLSLYNLLVQPRTTTTRSSATTLCYHCAALATVSASRRQWLWWTGKLARSYISRSLRMSKRRGVAFLKNIKGVKIWICSGLWSCAKDGGVFALLLQMRRREDGGVVVLQWWRAAAFSGECSRCCCRCGGEKMEVWWFCSGGALQHFPAKRTAGR